LATGEIGSSRACRSAARYASAAAVAGGILPKSAGGTLIAKLPKAHADDTELEHDADSLKPSHICEPHAVGDDPVW
jgi:hypothetical protein